MDLLGADCLFLLFQRLTGPKRPLPTILLLLPDSNLHTRDPHRSPLRRRTCLRLIADGVRSAYHSSLTLPRHRNFPDHQWWRRLLNSSLSCCRRSVPVPRNRRRWRNLATRARYTTLDNLLHFPSRTFLPIVLSVSHPPVSSPIIAHLSLKSSIIMRLLDGSTYREQPENFIVRKGDRIVSEPA